MNKFSQSSLTKLNSCHELLQDVFNSVIQVVDCTIVQGHRGELEQMRLFNIGNSRVRYPNSGHNSRPSMAVDVVPYPIDWIDYRRFCYFAGIVLGVAGEKGIKLRWGGDWNMDTQLKDNSFNDYPHFELRGV